MLSWASQAHAFPQTVEQRLFWLQHWSVPHVHTSGAFSPSEWGPDPQCQAAQVIHWWWQCLAAWHFRSVWSLPCHFAADIEALALSLAKFHWHGALHSAHKSIMSKICQASANRIFDNKMPILRLQTTEMSKFKNIFTYIIIISEFCLTSLCRYILKLHTAR